MQLAGPNELGYANAALVTALFDVLVNKGILTRSDLEEVTAGALRQLRPDQNISSIKGAITFIEAAIIPEIRKHGPT